MEQGARRKSLIETVSGLIGRTARRNSDEESQDFQNDRDLIGGSDMSSSPELVGSNFSSSPPVVLERPTITRRIDPSDMANLSLAGLGGNTQQVAKPNELFIPDGSNGEPLEHFHRDHAQLTFRPGVETKLQQEKKLNGLGRVGRRPQACAELETYKRDQYDMDDLVPCELVGEVLSYYENQIQSLRNARDAPMPYLMDKKPNYVLQVEAYIRGASDDMPSDAAFSAVEYYRGEIEKERAKYLRSATNAAKSKTKTKVNTEQSPVEVKSKEQFLKESDQRAKLAKVTRKRSKLENVAVDTAFTTEGGPSAGFSYSSFSGPSKLQPVVRSSEPETVSGAFTRRSVNSQPALGHSDHQSNEIMEGLRHARADAKSLGLQILALRAENCVNTDEWEIAISHSDELLRTAEAQGDAGTLVRALYIKGRAQIGREEWDGAADCFNAALGVGQNVAGVEDYFIRDWNRFVFERRDSL